MLVFYANQSHHLEHVIDVYKKYDGPKKLLTTLEMSKHIEGVEGVLVFEGKFFLRSKINSLFSKYPNLKVLVPNYGSIKTIHYVNPKIPVILVEHGNGQMFDCDHYFWGRKHNKDFMESLKYMICPHQYLADTVKENNPELNVYIGGCPKLDQYVDLAGYDKSKENKLIVFSWHWECHVLPETLGGFNEWKDVLLRIAKHHNIAVHGHPKVQNKVKNWANGKKIQFIADFDEVIRKADVYVCDYSSTIYEFAATDKPVVVLNNSWYRKDIKHGLRFWQFADIGVNCNKPQDLLRCLDKAIIDHHSRSKKRKQVTELMYPYMGNSVDKYVEILKGIMDD